MYFLNWRILFRFIYFVSHITPYLRCTSSHSKLLLVVQVLLRCTTAFLFCSWKPRLSPLLALCVFLVCEQHRAEDSDWFAYINVLPATYTCPAYFSDNVIALLPASIQSQARDQREAVKQLNSSNQDFFR